MSEFLVDRRRWRDGLDVGKGAIIEHFYSVKEGMTAMGKHHRALGILARKPSGYAPVLMSLLALCVVLMAISTGHTRREPDEGTSAHIWQLLIAGQLPFLLWFASRWLRRDLKSGLPVLGAQIVAIAVAAFPVWLLGL
ncbi:hypothetical protein ABDK56_11885 [Sphingomonas sp. ASV193]|uniref:hypothetical protein n=1 Tax=Sphingomonas sp. ASV193 TaxID=3144405 RepID=UPI0032E89ABB